MMTDAFLRAYNEVLGLEGGYTNHPDDPGGRTQYGICERDYPELWVDGPPALEDAQQVYWRDFWQPCRLDGFTSSAVRNEVFEAAVNCGAGRAQRWLQEAYNICRPEDWVDLVVDGWLGAKTHAAVNRMTGHRESWETALVHCANALQAHHYIWLGNRSMIRGWLAKRVQFVA